MGKGRKYIFDFILISNKHHSFLAANNQKSKKLRQSQEYEDLLRHVLSLRSQAPQQYTVNLVQQNVKYFKNLVSNFV